MRFFVFMLICPVCGGALPRYDAVYRCAEGHCFDRSRYGYVNLLSSRGPGDRRHGDDMAMLTARREFLDSGYYQPLCQAVCEQLGHGSLLDVGCGEGYYTAAAAEVTKSAVIGIDISTAALRLAHRRLPGGEFAAASAFSLPVASGSADYVLNLFAPHDADELHRVMSPNGRLIRAFPLPRHLWELKSLLYEQVYENKLDDLSLDGFELLHKQELRYKITLKTESELQSLFRMTPYWYKSSEQSASRLNGVNGFVTAVEFCIAVYKKQ